MSAAAVSQSCEHCSELRMSWTFGISITQPPDLIL